MRTVGVIGVGVMGSAIAGHLLDGGFEVVGYDVEPSRLEFLVERGGAAAGSCGEVVEQTGFLITSLPTETAFEQVIAEVAAGGTTGSVVADTSTLSLDAKQRGRDVLAERGAYLLDCPISGTGQQARRKDAVVYVSGDRAIVDGTGPVFDGFARAWHHVGAFGAGSTLKFIANLLVTVHNVAAAEALVLANKAGLDLDAILPALGDGAGASRMLQVRGPVMARGDYDDVGIRLRTFGKDLEIIAAFARSYDCPAPLFAAASELYTSAMRRGWGELDTACVYEVLSELADAGSGLVPEAFDRGASRWMEE